MRVTAIKPKGPSDEAEGLEGLQERKLRFDEKHKDWVEAQRRHFERHGLWNDELRMW